MVKNPRDRAKRRRANAILDGPMRDALGETANGAYPEGRSRRWTDRAGVERPTGTGT
jgi:hypothetical protein